MVRLAFGLPFWGVDWAVFAVERSLFLSLAWVVPVWPPDRLAAVVVDPDPGFVVWVLLLPPAES